MKKYMNRELSWLSFNERVLQEAEDETVPLLERLKFLGISSSNLDEFFSVRVGRMDRLIDSGHDPSSFLGGKPEKIRKETFKRIRALRGEYERTQRNVFEALRKEGIIIVDGNGLDEQQERWLKKYFQDKVRSRLVPIMLENVEDFPYLENLFVYLAIVLKKKNRPSKEEYALIELPADVLPRFTRLPARDNKPCIIVLDEIIRFGLSDAFSMFDYDDISAYSIKMTRDSQLDIERDLTTSFFGEVERSLKSRNDGEPVRFVYDRDIPKKLLSYIVKKNNLPEDMVISGGRYHNNRDFVSFPNLGSKYDRLRYRNPEPLEHPVLRNHKSIFDALDEQDVLLHYPYQSFQYVVEFLREAAVNRHVTSIRMTLYRVADDSEIVNALINAIRNGKKVTVFVEIQARFDEEANIEWTQRLAEEGANVIREIPGMKIHSKLILITRRKGGKRTRYACVGTGNFDESTAKIYTDHALLTSNPAVVDEVREVFRFLERSFKPFEYKNLLVSPFNMEQELHRMIDTEIKNARKGKDAFIHAKLNGISQKRIMKRLYKAGKAGVDVKMVIRGVCCLVPGVKEFSSNIEVLSIVDKYLEHSRIYIFCNNNNPLVFISSADWMPRNLEKRVEVATRILDEELKQELIDYMNIQLEDNVKARVINENQDNSERNIAGSKRVRAQVKIYEYLRKRLKTDTKH